MKTNNVGPYWVAMPVLRNKIMLGARNEQEVALICRAGNIAPHELNNIDLKVSLEANIAILGALQQISGDPHIGLHLGEKMTPATLGQAGHLQHSSSTVLAAFKKTIYFARTFTTVHDNSFEEKEQEVFFYYEPVPLWNDLSPETARQAVDLPFAATLNFIRLLSGQTVFPTKVMYRYPKIADTTEHERIFRCKPLFNQPGNCIVFKKDELEVPVLGYNPQLNAVIENMLREKLRQDREGVPFTEKIKETILASYRNEIPQLENIAVALHVTPRTLQRKLREENTSYRQVNDAIRFELATSLLKHKDLTVAEIAFKLGYADASSFRKAFKVWKGTASLNGDET